MLALALGLSALVLFITLGILWLSFHDGAPGGAEKLSLQNYATVWSDPRTLPTLRNTLEFSVTALAIALACGLPLAWLVERTDFRGKNLLFTLLTLGVLMPGFAAAMGWLFLLHPRIGLLNAWLRQLFSLDAALLDITSIWGMGWVEGLSLAPVAFIMMAAVFRAMDPALEDAAQMCGANFRQTLWRVTLRLAFPGIVAASIYIFTIGFAAFDVPAIIGWSSRRLTFSTLLLLLLNSDNALPKYGAGAALSLVVMAAALLLSLWYAALQRRSHRYAVVTGKAYRPHIVTLGRYRHMAIAAVALYLILSLVLPCLTLIWAALLPFFQLPSARALAALSLRNFAALPLDLVWPGFRNTLLLALLTPTIALGCSIAFSWVVLRSRYRWRAWLDVFAFLPHAIPSVVFGMGALLVTLFLIDRIVPIYGTIWILLIVFVIARLSYGTRVTNGGLIQIHRELDEAAVVSGADTGGVLRRVLLPLLAPSLVYGFLWIALLTLRELTLAAFLTTKDNLTLPVVVWSLWQGGETGPAAALTAIMLAAMGPGLALYWWIGRRRIAIAE